MLICIVTATAASLVSARFANKVQSRTVGLVTGCVLTLLGASMLILNYWGFLSGFDLFVEILHCIGTLVAFIIPCLIILLPVRFLTNIPSFVFRKLLHIVAVTCVSLTILTSKSWQAASMTCVIFAVIIYPLLTLVEKEGWYPKLFVEKTKGEIRRSLLMLFFMVAFLIMVCWGFFNEPNLCAASILMWGTGDAAAALFGIPYGKHKIKTRWTDGKKSWEGSLSMFVVSFASGLLMLLLTHDSGLGYVLLSALSGALLGAMTELFSPSEYDTITVPAVIAAVLLIINSTVHVLHF